MQLKLIGMVIFVLAVTALAFINASSVKTYQTLLHDGIATTATVIDVNPGNHNQARYSFTVAGSTYTGDSFGLPSARVGERIRIYYSRTDPHQSCPCSPSDALRDTLVSSALAVVFITVLGTLIVWRSLNHR